jgi:branched-chain amino acid transport system permease protein
MNLQRSLLARSRWRPWEIGAWIVLWALPLVAGQHAALINEIAILALFALSLDLILGYAGIVSLGHAAFFGIGAYGAGLFAKHVMPDPLMGLLVAMALSGLLGFITSPMIVRGTDLTRLMVTMGVALVLYELANKFDGLTGGADGLSGVVIGPLLGRFEFDLGARVASTYSMAVLFIAFVLMRRIVHSPFGSSLQALRDNRLRLSAIGLSINGRLAAVYTLAAALAGAAGALLTQTTGFASLDAFDFHRSADVMLALVIGGVGWLWGGIVGAIAFKVLHDLISAVTAQYWTFWIGLFLVVLMLVGREKLFRPWTWWKKRS